MDISRAMSYHGSMRPHGTSQQLEKRRLRAMAMPESGKSYQTVANSQHPRIHVEEFPAYAPELNPAEYIWNQTDRALSNTAPQDLEELQALLSNSVAKIGNSQKLLWSCIYASDLPWR
jgi:transposase